MMHNTNIKSNVNQDNNSDFPCDLFNTWKEEISNSNLESIDALNYKYNKNKKNLRKIKNININLDNIKVITTFIFIISGIFTIPLYMFLLHYLNNFFIFNTVYIGIVLLTYSHVSYSLWKRNSIMIKKQIEILNNKINNYNEKFINKIYNKEFLTYIFPEIQKNSTPKDFDDFKLAIYKKNIDTRQIFLIYNLLENIEKSHILNLDIKDLLKISKHQETNSLLEPEEDLGKTFKFFTKCN